jgi:hypothetical protein
VRRGGGGGVDIKLQMPPIDERFMVGPLMGVGVMAL